MKRSTIIWILIILVVIIAVFWYWGSMMPQNQNVTNTNTGTLNQTSTTAPPAPVIADLNTASTGTLGTYLTAENGMTLYAYTKDTPGVSNCTGECAVTWPPYTVPPGETSSTLTIGVEVPGQIGTITRTDGTEQITYNNIPLYYYSKDQVVGDTMGENVEGTWFVVPPTTASSSTIPTE